MIESPLIQEMEESGQKILTARFGPLPADLVAAIKGVKKEAQLEKLVQWAALCPDVAAFRSQL